MQDHHTRVALLGFRGVGNAAVSVSVARALRAGWTDGLELAALGYDPFMGGAWVPRLIDRFHLLPDGCQDDESLIDHILDIHTEHPLDALIVCEHAEVPAIANFSERLAEAGVRTLVPRSDRIAAVARPRMAAFFHEHDLPTPHTLFVPAQHDVAASAEQLGFPLWVKGPLDGAAKVHSAEQARDAAERVRSTAQGGVLLQRVVEGETFDVGMVVSRSGHCTGLVATRRLAVNDEGQVVCGSVVDDPQIDAIARRVLESLEWRGALKLELARSTRGKQLYVCDLRARLPAWSMLTHWSDCNLPARLLNALLERNESEHTGPRAGRIYVRGVCETAISLDHLVRLDRRRQSEGIKNPEFPNTQRAQDDPDKPGLRVAVTGTSTFDVINPGIGVARALRLAPEISRIYGLSYGTFDSGIYEPGLFDASFQLPAGGSASAILERLLEIHQAHPFDVVVPCLDGELPQFISISERLAAAGIRSLLPGREALDRRAKTRLFGGGVTSEWGSFELPESIVAASEAEVLQAARNLGFPVAVKGPIAECIRARNRSEAKAAWRRLTAFGSNEVIVQPFISGKFFAVASVFGDDHRPLTTMTVKKLAICERGSTWSAIRVANPRLEADCNRLLSEIDWVGPAEAEFIRDELRDRYYLIEVNPRFTAWIYFSACLGTNHPRIAVRAAVGESVEIADNEVTDLATDLVFLRATQELPVKATSLAAISTKGYVHHGHM
jgi:carbamoyl-phosphate synthase large subunit